MNFLCILAHYHKPIPDTPALMDSLCDEMSQKSLTKNKSNMRRVQSRSLENIGQLFYLQYFIKLGIDVFIYLCFEPTQLY